MYTSCINVRITCIRGLLKALTVTEKHSAVDCKLTSPLEVFQVLVSTEGRVVTVLENSCYGILKRERKEMGRGKGEGGNETYDDRRHVKKVIRTLFLYMPGLFS